jgi:hypothetical protein
MSEMREHNILTLIRAYEWAVDQRRASWVEGIGDYPRYVVCCEAMVAIEAELKRRDRRSWTKWIHAPVGTKLGVFFMPEEADHV